jgi:uncharacterized protein YicC (UPF0701 family)
MVWVIFLVMFLMCIVAAIVYSNHTLRQQWEDAGATDVSLLREAMEHSVIAANTTNPLLALSEVVQAHSTLHCVLKRYGHQKEVEGLKVKDILQDVVEQHHTILQKICNEFPNIIPQGELVKHMNYIKKRKDSPNNVHDLVE